MERSIAGPIIRAGRVDDLDDLERLENAAFAMDRLSRRSLRYFLAAATTDTMVAADAGDMLGYAMIGYRKGSDIGRVFSLAVDRAAARQGIGSALMQACEAAARRRGRARMRLEVRADNAPAIRLYEREGFARLGLEPDYYEDGTAALLFGKALA